MNEGHDTSRHVWSLVRRAISPDSIARRGFAGMIREARRNRDSAETELSRDYFQWRAELLRDKAEYYCQPNTKATQCRGCAAEKIRRGRELREKIAALRSAANTKVCHGEKPTHE